MQAMQIADSCANEVKGFIIDAETNEPIAFATIMVKSTKEGAVTDENGSFSLNDLCGSGHTLICSCVGYKPITHHHDYFFRFITGV